MEKKLKSAVLNAKEKLLNSAKNYSIKLLFTKMMYLISGILISRGRIFGRYYPFGLSLSASVPGKLIAPTLIGATIGYLFPLNLAPAARYISTIIAIAAVRWTLSDLSKIKKHILYTPLIVFSSSFVTGLAMDLAYGIDMSDISISIIEALIAGIAAYFFDTTFKVILNKKIYSLSHKEFACIAVSISIAVFSLSEITISGISVGKILAITIILIFSHTLGTLGGAVCGIASGVIFSLPSFGQTYMSGSYALSGMICGMMNSFGKLGICALFLVTNMFMSFKSGDSSQMIIGAYETLIATAIFLLIPDSILNKIKLLSPLFYPKNESKAFKNFISQKLQFISKSIESVPQIVNKTSEKFFPNQKINTKDYCVESVYKQCLKCGLHKFCWNQNFTNTRADINFIFEKLSNNKKIYSDNCSNEFLNKCCKKEMVIQTIDSALKDFTKQQTAKIQLEEFKKLSLEQFGAVNSILNDLSDEIYKCQNLDEKLAARIQHSKKIPIEIEEVYCFENKIHKLFIEIKTPNFPNNNTATKISKEVSTLCGRKMGEISITNFGNKYKVNLSETKKFYIHIGVSQHACNNAKLCGDSCCYFEDGRGNFNVILSDGMGTGGKAAAQGMMATELMENFMKSGIGTEGSLKFVNSALLMNSNDEFLSTMDALSIDLYTGDAHFLKAGAPPTFILREGKITTLNFESLPIGILSTASFSNKFFKLKNGDIILMVSDGATDIGSEWITHILSEQTYTSPKGLADMVVKAATMLRNQTHDDDISAIAMTVS